MVVENQSQYPLTEYLFRQVYRQLSNLFRRVATKRDQILLFGDNGYVHNPIKILFDPNENRNRTLIVCLFNETIAGHLLKFHNKL